MNVRLLVWSWIGYCFERALKYFFFRFCAICRNQIFWRTNHVCFSPRLQSESEEVSMSLKCLRDLWWTIICAVEILNSERMLSRDFEWFQNLNNNWKKILWWSKIEYLNVVNLFFYNSRFFFSSICIILSSNFIFFIFN